MTEPYVCKRCNRKYEFCICRVPVEPYRSLLATYTELREECNGLEMLLENGGFDKKEMMRLDKAVTVMKCGFKIVKKVIKHRRNVQALKEHSAELPRI